MAKPVCLRYYKFLRAAKIHKKICSPGLDPNHAPVESRVLRILQLRCRSKSLESDASRKMQCTQESLSTAFENQITNRSVEESSNSGVVLDRI